MCSFPRAFSSWEQHFRFVLFHLFFPPNLLYEKCRPFTALIACSDTSVMNKAKRLLRRQQSGGRARKHKGDSSSASIRAWRMGLAGSRVLGLSLRTWAAKHPPAGCRESNSGLKHLGWEQSMWTQYSATAYFYIYYLFSSGPLIFPVVVLHVKGWPWKYCWFGLYWRLCKRIAELVGCGSK